MFLSQIFWPFPHCLPKSTKRLHPLVSPRIWVGGSLTHSKPILLLPVSLNVNQTTHSLHAFIDTGAEQNLIDFKLAKQLHLSLIPFDPPILAMALNNQVLALITHQTEPIILTTFGNHWEVLTFFTLKCMSRHSTSSWLRLAKKA